MLSLLDLCITEGKGEGFGWAEVGITLEYFLFFFYFLMFIFERQSVSRGGAEREGDTESELSAQSPTWGSNPRTARSRPEPKSGAQPTEPPGRSWTISFKL